MNESKVEEVVEKLVRQWEKEINDFEACRLSREVDNVNYFRMNGKRPELDNGPDAKVRANYCYKVNFTFDDDVNDRTWNDRIEDFFIDKFKTDKNPRKDEWGSLIFKNHKVDYYTNQTSRIIIQFYPLGFLQEIRAEKLEKIGI